MMALEYLNTATAGADTPDIVDVLQWLDQDTTEVIEPLIGAAADLEMQEFLLMLERLALNTAAGIEAAAALINDMSPAAGRDAILHIADTYGPDAAPQVLAAMDPAAAGAIVIFDQSLHLYNQTNRGASEGTLPGPTQVVEQLLMLSVSAPESAGAILSAAGENDIEVGGHVLESMIRAGVNGDIAKTLIHTDPVVAAELLNEALQTEQDATPDWTPETSKVLDVVEGLWQAGLDEGEPDRGAAITAAFTLTQDVLTEEQEDTFLATLGATFQAKVQDFTTDTYKLFKEIYTDALAHKNAATKLNKVYEFFKKVYLTGKEAAKAGQEIVNDLLGGSDNPDNGPDGDGSIGPVDQLALDAASNFLSSIGGGQVKVLAVITLRSPELTNDVLEEVSTQTPNGLLNATTWETQLVETGPVTVLGVDGKFEFIVDTVHEITGVDIEVLTKMFSGKLSFEEGAEGGAHLISDMMMEALGDPDHEYHDQALAVVDTIGQAAQDVHDWEELESSYLQDIWDAAKSGQSFFSLASLLMSAASGAQAFVSAVQHASAAKAVTEQATEWTIDDIKEMIPNYEEIVADMEVAYDEAIAAFVDSQEGRRALAADDIEFVDGGLRTISSGRTLSATEQQSTYDKFIRLDYAFPELSITISNSDGSIADSVVQFRVFFTHPKVDEDGNRYFGFRVRVLDQTGLATGNLPLGTGGDVTLFGVRDLVDLKIYDEGENIRDIKIEILDLELAVETAEVEQEEAEVRVDELTVYIQEREDEKSALETGDLVDADAAVAADRTTVNGILPNVPSTVSAAYSVVSDAFDERDSVYQDAASTDAEKQVADQAVTTALEGLDTAVAGTDSVVDAAEIELNRINGTNSTQAEINRAQDALDIALVEKRNSLDLKVEVGGLNETLEGRVDIYERIATLEGKIGTLETKLTTAEGEVTTATTNLAAAQADLTMQTPILQAELEDIDPDDEGKRLGPILYQSNWGALGEIASPGNLSSHAGRLLHNFFSGTDDQILTVEDAEQIVADAEAEVLAFQDQRDDLQVDLDTVTQTLTQEMGALNSLERLLPNAQLAYESAVSARDLAADVVDYLEETREYLIQVSIEAVLVGDTLGETDALKAMEELGPQLVDAREELANAEILIISTGDASRSLQQDVTTQEMLVRNVQGAVGAADNAVVLKTVAITQANLDVLAGQDILQLATDWENGEANVRTAGGTIGQYSQTGFETGVGGGINTAYNLHNLENDEQAALFMIDWAGAAIGGGLGYSVGLGLNWLLFSHTNAGGQTVDGVLAEFTTAYDFLVGNGIINNAADIGSMIGNLIVAGQIDDSDKISQAGIGFFWAAFKPRGGLGDNNLFGGRIQFNVDFPSTDLI